MAGDPGARALDLGAGFGARPAVRSARDRGPGGDVRAAAVSGGPLETRAFIDLESFASERRGFGRYRFDPEARAWFHTPCADAAEAAAGTAGYADEPEVGLLARRRVFVTLHVMEDRVASFVDGRTFLWPGPLVAARTSTAPGAKRFEIRERGRRLVRFDYWHADPPGFPGALATDLFRLIAEVTKSEFSMRRFLERRRAVIAPR